MKKIHYTLLSFVIMAVHEQNKSKSIPNIPKEVSSIDLNKRKIIIKHEVRM